MMARKVHPIGFRLQRYQRSLWFANHWVEEGEYEFKLSEIKRFIFDLFFLHNLFPGQISVSVGETLFVDVMVAGSGLTFSSKKRRHEKIRQFCQQKRQGKEIRRRNVETSLLSYLEQTQRRIRRLSFDRSRQHAAKSASLYQLNGRKRKFNSLVTNQRFSLKKKYWIRSRFFRERKQVEIQRRRCWRRRWRLFLQARNVENKTLCQQKRRNIQKLSYFRWSHPLLHRIGALLAWYGQHKKVTICIRNGMNSLFFTPTFQSVSKNMTTNRLFGTRQAAPIFIEKAFFIASLFFSTAPAVRLATYVKDELQKSKKRQQRFLYQLDDLLKFIFSLENCPLKGARVEIRGRPNGRSRSKVSRFQSGPISLQQVSSDVDYSFQNVFSRHGSFGVKVWVLKKKNYVLATKTNKV